MNPLNINHIKVEKANTIKLRYQKLRNITNFFRVFEIFLVIAVISRISFQLPLALAFKLSNEYLHNLSLILVSPQFVFVLGNAIVITLFVNSGQLHNNSPCKVKTPKAKPKPKPKPKSTSPKYEHNYNSKVTKMQPKKVQGIRGDQNSIISTIFDSSEQHQVMKIYRRSKSEKLKREKIEKGCLELRRSNTEIKSLKGCCKEAGEREIHYPEDHMSNEEFRKTVENFIAKQQRFLREEEEDFSALGE